MKIENLKVEIYDPEKHDPDTIVDIGVNNTLIVTSDDLKWCVAEVIDGVDQLTSEELAEGICLCINYCFGKSNDELKLLK